jgi:hypothetical protein
MSVQVIDGTLESIEAGRTAKGISVFKSARFTTADGTTKTLPKFVAPSAIAADLVPGARGRFYHYKSIDHQGIVGMRMPDGRSAFHFPRNNEYIAVGVVVLNILWLAMKIVAEDRIPFLAVGLIVLGSVLWVISRKSRNEAQALFDAG